MTGTRRAVASVLLATLVLASGCSFLTGQSALQFTANDVSVSQSAQSETGYDEARTTTHTVNRTFSVANQTRTVTVVNKLAEYKRQVSLGPLGSSEFARFTVFATPKVDIAGRTFNPVGKMSNAELAMMVQEKYSTVDNVQQVGNRTATMLGEETTVAKFSAQAQTVGGQSVDVYLHIAQVSDGEDYVLAIAVHPQQLDEEANVDSLMAGVQHG